MNPSHVSLLLGFNKSPREFDMQPKKHFRWIFASLLANACCTGCEQASVSGKDYAAAIRRSGELNELICGELLAARDAGTAASASDNIRRVIPELTEVLGDVQQFALSASPDEFRRVAEEANQGSDADPPNFLSTIEQVSRGPAGQELKPVLRELVKAMRGAMVRSVEKRRLEDTARQLDLL